MSAIRAAGLPSAVFVGLLALVSLVAVPDLAALTAFKGKPSLRVWVSNSLGQPTGKPVTSGLEGVAARFRDWPAVVQDKEALVVLSRLVSGKVDNAWGLLVLEGSGTYTAGLARIVDAPEDGIWIREADAADLAASSMELSLLFPPAGAGDAVQARAVCTLKDGTRLEETWADGLKTAQYRYGSSGRLEMEFRYREGGLVEGSTNTWKDRRLDSTKIYDPWGLRVTNSLVYTATGSLRGSHQEYPGKGDDLALYARSADKGWESWEQNQGGELRLAYDKSRRVQSRTLWKDGVLKSRTDYQYQSPDSMLLLSIQIEEPGAKRKILEVYDPEGRLSSRDETVGSRLLGRESFVYDEDRHLVLHTLDKEGKNHEWTWVYEDGNLAVERYQENSLPVWEIRHDGDKREEDVFVKGKLVLRTWYEGKRKTMQEEYKGGKLIGSKTY